MKRLSYALLAAAALFFGSWGSAFAVSTFITQQGGTGTTSPSGLLYGDNSATQHLNTVTIGSNLTFSGGVLSATGTGGSSFGYPFPSNATTTVLTFSNGITLGSFTGTLNANNGVIYPTSTSTPTVTAPITYSGTLGSFIGGVSGTFDCITATGSVKGCLSAADFTTFNAKQPAGNYITALTGDVTASGPGSAAATLATVNGNVGSFTNANITVNAKGLITAASNGAGGSGGAIGTSTGLVNGQVDFSTSVNTIANDATFLFDSTLKKLTVNNASTTNLTIGVLSGILKQTGGVVVAATPGTDYENPLTFVYPLVRAVNAISLAFGTTTSNTWAGTQTFTNSPVFSTLGVGTVNSTAAGAIYNTATNTPVVGTGLSYSGTTFPAGIGGNSGTLTNTGVISNSCPGGFLSCSGTNPSAFTLGTLGIGNGGTGTSTSGIQGQTWIVGPSGTFNATSSLFFGTNSFLGIGTTSPSFKIDLQGTDSTSSAYYATRFSSDAQPGGIIGRKARGTQQLPTAALSGDSLAIFGAHGYGTTGWGSTSSVGGITIRAAENFSDTNKGTLLSFETTPIGATTRSTRATLDSAGNFGIGTSTLSQLLSVQGNGLFSGNLSAANVTATGTLTLSALTGTQCLQEVSGVVSGTGSACGSGGSGSPGGASSTIQFNRNGVFGGALNVFTDGTNFGIATASPMSALSVVGNEDHWGGYYHYGPSPVRDTSFCNRSTDCLTYVGDDNTTNGVNFEVGNNNAGTNAYSWIGETNGAFDNAGTFFAGLGLNGQNYGNNGFGTGLTQPSELQLISNVGDIAIGSGTTTNPWVRIFVGGFATTNEIARFTTTGLGIGTTTPSANLSVNGTTTLVTGSNVLYVKGGSSGGTTFPGQSVRIEAGDAGTTTNDVAGAINIIGGDGTTASTGSGGAINILAGNSANTLAPNVNITAGSVIGGLANGGSVNFTAGQGGNNNGQFNFTGSSTTMFNIGTTAGGANPMFRISTGGLAATATGISITGAATGGTTAIAAIDSGANSSLSIASKGTGTLALNSGGTGNITVGPAGTTRYTFAAAQLSLNPNGRSTSAANPFFKFVGGTGAALTTTVEATEDLFDMTAIQSHASGAITQERDIRVIPTTNTFTAGTTNANSTIGSSTSLSIDGPPTQGLNVNYTNAQAVFIGPGGTYTSGSTTNAIGLVIQAPVGAANNYAASTSGRIVMSSLGTIGTGDTLCRNAAGEIGDAGGTTCAISNPLAKHNIRSLTSSDLGNFMKLNPIHYLLNGSNIAQYGFNALEVNAIYPDAVELATQDVTVTGVDGKPAIIKKGQPKTVDYEHLVALDTYMIQQQELSLEKLGAGARRSMTDDWQWYAIGLLAFWNLLITGFLIRKRNS